MIYLAFKGEGGISKRHRLMSPEYENVRIEGTVLFKMNEILKPEATFTV